MGSTMILSRLFHASPRERRTLLPAPDLHEPRRSAAGFSPSRRRTARPTAVEPAPWSRARPQHRSFQEQAPL